MARTHVCGYEEGRERNLRYRSAGILPAYAAATVETAPPHAWLITAQAV